MLGKLICKLPRWLGGGHKRGKRVTDIKVVEGQAAYRCPRCKAIRYRSAPKAKAGV